MIKRWPIFAVFTVGLAFAPLANKALAGNIAGEWAAYQEDCGKAPGDADTVTITRNKLSGIEWECKVLKRSKKGRDTVDSVLCTNGVDENKGTVRYHVDRNGALHVRWSTGSSDTYQYKCK